MSLIPVGTFPLRPGSKGRISFSCNGSTYSIRARKAELTRKPPYFMEMYSKAREYQYCSGLYPASSGRVEVYDCFLPLRCLLDDGNEKQFMLTVVVKDCPCAVISEIEMKLSA